MSERMFTFGDTDGPWSGEPGDVIEQRGPRIGCRYWLVLDVVPARRWAKVLCRRLESAVEITGAIIDAQRDGTVWTIGPRR